MNKNKNKNKTAPSHDEIVHKVVRHLQSRFFRNIRANAEGIMPPPKAFSLNDGMPLVPDVTVGSDSSPKHIFEVETAETLCDDCAGNRWKTFSSIANKCGGNFSVVVPKGMAELAMTKMAEHSLDERIWEI